MRKIVLFFIVLTVAFPVIAGREEQILQQSDDTADFLWSTDNWAWAQWFDAPADCYILSASFYVDENGTKYVGVWDNDDGGTYDLPGTLLGSVSHNFDYGGSPTWSDYVDLTDLGITLTGGERFWVGVVYAAGDNPYMGLDTTNPDHGAGYQTDGFTWQFSSSFDLMVRVKIDDDMDPPYVDEQDPAPDRTGGADPGTDIVFHCKDDDKGVDPGTIGFTADDGTKADVSGTLDIDDADLNAVICTFTPDSDLPEGATITCTVDGELADGLGNEMGSDAVWSFTVGYVNVDEASLGEIKATYR
jgi:hypothetical protein